MLYLDNIVILNQLLMVSQKNKGHNHNFLKDSLFRQLKFRELEPFLFIYCKSKLPKSFPIFY